MVPLSGFRFTNPFLVKLTYDINPSFDVKKELGSEDDLTIACCTSILDARAADFAICSVIVDKVGGQHRIG